MSKISMLFFIIHIRPNLRSNFGNQPRLERFKKIIFILKNFGSRGEFGNIDNDRCAKMPIFSNQKTEQMHMPIVQAN